jgi:diguanylate cyclase
MDNEDLPLHSHIEHDDELLKRSLVKVSFAASGIHKNLDNELQKLRQIIRAEADNESIHQQVEAIAQALMVVDDEAKKQKSQLTPDELLQSLSIQLGADLPEFSTKINRVLTDNKKQPFIATFSKLIQLFPALSGAKPAGFFARLFSKPVVQANVSNTNDELIPRVTVSLNRILTQLSALNPSTEKIAAINNKIESMSSVDDIPSVFQSVFSQIFDISAAEQLRFETFLKSLNAKLDSVQLIISNNHENQISGNSAGQLLDQQVRSQVKTLQEKSASIDNIEELKHVVEDRVEEMLTNLDTYKIDMENFVEKNSEQMKDLNTELSSSRTDIEKLQEQLKEQKHLAETDPLTGLPNRYSFQRLIQGEYTRWRRYRQPLTIAIADVDNFKVVNDSLGHSLGDKVLISIADLFSSALRETDHVARYGGEEFIFIMPETTLTQATKAVNKLRQQIASHKFNFDGESLSITVSFGVAEFEDNDTIDDVIERSDKALYRAKDKGRNQVCCELKAV